MIQTVKMNLDDGERLALVAKALSSEVRIEMLKALRQKEYNVNELAEVLGFRLLRRLPMLRYWKRQG